jgi:phosphoribosylanthranilate isomerase
MISGARFVNYGEFLLKQRFEMAGIPKVKICGITNAEDAAVAVAAGADALGFVLYRKSPRFIEPALARQIIMSLPPLVIPVGVFVDEEQQTVRNLMDDCGLTIAQLHGNESAIYCKELGRTVLKALRVKDRSTFLSLAEYRGRAGVRGFVLDAFSDQAYGGTGQVIDWQLAAEVAKAANILLAGGLTPGNVEKAILAVQPYGVDVSSGVERELGKKDHEKVRAFIQAARGVSWR